MRLSRRDWITVRAALWAAEKWHEYTAETMLDGIERRAQVIMAARIAAVRDRLIEHGVGVGDAYPR